MKQYLEQAANQEVKDWINTTLKAHIKKEQENQTEIEHIIDYLNSPQAPKRLRQMSYEAAKRNTEKWTKALEKKGAHIVETDEDVKVILRSKTTGFKFVKLIGENAFKREGFLMRHCSASYAHRTDTEVYSLRDAQNMPHCTIEVQRQNNQIHQIKGKGNGPIHPDYIKYVLKILKYFKMDVRSQEMENLGYYTLSKDLWAYIEKHFKNVQYISFNNEKYIYSKTKMEAIDERAR